MINNRHLKKTRKTVILTLSAIFMFALACVVVHASDEITKTVEFTSESNKPNYADFPKEITEESTKYQLGEITYEKLSEKKETVLQDKTTTVSKNNLKDKSYAAGDTESITVDGKDYTGTVVNVKYTDLTIGDRYGEVSGTQDYGLRVDKPNPPSTKSLPYYDELTGQSFNVEAPMTKLEQTSSAWQDYTYIDIVVSNYTDTQFMFNDVVIYHNGNSVLDSSHYPELLSMAGLKGENYKINSVNWMGDSYKSGNVRYRNARANIQAYSSSYTAYYHKSFSLPDVPSYSAEITFKYSQENVSKTVYTYKATGHYTSIEEPGKANSEQTTGKEALASTKTPKDIPITIKTVTTISLILVLALAFVLLGFFMLTKIKSKNTKLSKVLNKRSRR